MWGKDNLSKSDNYTFYDIINQIIKVAAFKYKKFGTVHKNGSLLIPSGFRKKAQETSGKLDKTFYFDNVLYYNDIDDQTYYDDLDDNKTFTYGNIQYYYSVDEWGTVKT